MNSIKIAVNGIKRLLREPQAILLMLIFPFFAGILSVNISTTYDIDKVGISDKIDRANPLVRMIEQTGKFDVEFVAESQIENMVINKEIDIGLIIPEELDRIIIDKTPFRLICAAKTSNVIFLRVFLDGYTKKTFNIEISEHSNNVQSNIVAPRTSLGFFLLFILLFSGTCTQMLLEDKKSKTYTRYFYTPIKEIEIYIGIFIINFVLGILQITFFLLASNLIFNFDWRIPVSHVFIILVTFLITSIGISIGIVGFINDSKVYSLVYALLAIFTCFFGGAYFSSSLMGEYLDKIANFFPQKWAMLTYEELVTGHDFSDVVQNLLIMLLFAAVFFTFGINVLRPNDTEL